MCLTKLEKFTPCEVGYQVKKKQSGREFFGGLVIGKDKYQSIHFASTIMKLNKKYRGSGERILSWGNAPILYKSGPHVFHIFEDAKEYHTQYSFKDPSYVIVEIKVHGAYATGYQGSAKVTVAKAVTITREVEV